MKFILEDEMNSVEMFHGEKVLIADDNDLNLQVIKMILEDQGLVVDAVASGEEAMQMYMESDEFSYRMILIDINMYGMNGYDTAVGIRKCNREDCNSIPLYAVSANILPEDRNHARETGMDGYIMKPINYAELFEAMHKLFDEQNKEREN